MRRTMWIKSLTRTTEEGETETLTFMPGINAIVGPPNSGKTKWLQMLDFTLGDTGTPEGTFSQDLADKYKSLSCVVQIGENEHVIERHWKEPGKKGSVLVDNRWISGAEFSSFIYPRLEIPELHFPKGNPFAERAWATITWRILFRHIYREQRFWGDIADRQPEGEQFAAISQLLGVAENLFPQELGKVVERRKALYRLQARKEQYQELLDQVSKEILSTGGEISVVTQDVLDDQIRRLEQEIVTLMEQRRQIMTSLASSNSQSSGIQSPFDDVNIGKRRVYLSEILENYRNDYQLTRSRLSELNTYKSTIQQELSRLRRASIAGTLFADLKVTHCPVCDQEANERETDPGHCYLCKKSHSSQSIDNRLQFEINQLDEELREITPLIEKLAQEEQGLTSSINQATEEISFLEQAMQPARQNLLALMPAELPTLDAMRGRLEERIESTRRLKRLLIHRDELSKQIEDLEREIGKLDSTVDRKSSDANLETAADALTDGMNTYLQRLRALGENYWPHGRVTFRLRDRGFSFQVGGQALTSLGATYLCYFLMSYHFSLLALSSNPARNYPGISIIDFPPELANQVAVDDSLIYLVTPYYPLCADSAKCEVQLIVAGAGFNGINYANQIDLSPLWRG